MLKQLHIVRTTRNKAPSVFDQSTEEIDNAVKPLCLKMGPLFSELPKGGFLLLLLLLRGGRPFVPDGGPDLRVPAEPGGGAHQVGVLRRRILRLHRQLLLLHQQHVSVPNSDPHLDNVEPLCKIQS